MARVLWKTFTILMLLQFCTAFSASVIPARAAGSVEMLSHVGYLDSEGNYRVVGEVQNVGSQAVNFIQVTATFYDSQNSVVDSRFDLTMLSVLLVGRKSPFEIALLDVAESARVTHYSLSVTYLETDAIPMKLEVSPTSNNINPDGSMTIYGNLTNLGDEKLVNAKVTATCYDKSSRVVAAAYTTFDLEVSVNPSQTVLFEIRLGKDRVQYVETYALAAESNQYAMIAEFPGYLMLPFGVLLISTVLLLNSRTRRNRLKRKHT